MTSLADELRADSCRRDRGVGGQRTNFLLSKAADELDRLEAENAEVNRQAAILREWVWIWQFVSDLEENDLVEVADTLREALR